MTDFASVWDSAGDEAERDQGLRALTSARVRVAPVWGFLAAAKSREEFGHRLALQEDRVREAAEAGGVSFEALAKSLADDFHILVEATPAPPRARRLAIFKVTAGDDSSAYYVEDEDSGKKVGGPYDDEDGARKAISGGDVEGDDLKVEKGSGGSDSDSDSDSDKDSDKKSDKGGNPFAKKDSDDDGDDDSDDSDSDKDSDKDDDDKGGNPFAKKTSALFPIIAMPGFGMGADEEYEDHPHSGGNHPTPSTTPHEHRVIMKMRDDSKNSSSPDTLCDNCGGEFDAYHSLHHMDKNCPHCGADPTHHKEMDSGEDYHHDDQDPHYGDHGHSEDNYGDPYGRFDEGSAYHQHMQGTLKTALPDGEDPLEWVVQSVPSGEGQPEKPDEHDESLALTSALVDRFRAVYNDFAGE